MKWFEYGSRFLRQASYKGSLATYAGSLASYEGSSATYAGSLASYAGSLARYRGSLASYAGSLASYASSLARYVSDNLNGTAHFKNVNIYLNTNIYSCWEISGGQSFDLYLNVVHFFNTGVN